MKRKGLFSICIGLAVGLFVVGLLVWYVATLPKLEEQLKYSPFKNEGVWQCEETNFVITSIRDDEGSQMVSGTINYNGEEINVEFFYLSTRGFNHKYSFVINVYTSSQKVFSCYGEFNENSFTLKEFSKDNIFGWAFSKLTFNKV